MTGRHARRADHLLRAIAFSVAATAAAAAAVIATAVTR